MSEPRQRPADDGETAVDDEDRVVGDEDLAVGDEVAPGERALAREVVVSYPADLSDWGRFQVEKPSFRAYLRKTKERAVPGDVWEEFVGVGCCGNTLDVPLRVERVAGGDRLGEDTIVSFEVREACDIDGGWRVQSADGPRRS